MSYKIPLYDEDERCVGRVNAAHNLDRWNGSNTQFRGTGQHSGLGKTRSGKYYQVHMSQWQGAPPAYAQVISADEAKSLAIEADDDALYEQLFGSHIPVLD